MTRTTAGALAALLFIAAAPSAFADQAPAPGTTSPTTQAAQPVSNPKGYDPNKVTCKHEETTGSRLGATRVCHTRADWDEIERVTQETTRGAEAGGYQSSFHGAATGP